MGQACAAHLRITRPSNAAVNRDVADGAPGAGSSPRSGQTGPERSHARGTAASQGERYVTAMLRTDIPAEIRCDQAMAAAGGIQAATTMFNTRPDCKDHTTTNDDKIRKILHLPLVT